MRKVQIYINGERLELFNDEKIKVNSSIQNVYDISKVFTDYSQGFTVPASPHNNNIFQHFYNSDVDGTFDYQIRNPAKIEIETIPFKIGRIQLEKANIKNGQIESYTCTFYGEIVTLKDTFGEDKLNTLDFSAIDLPYSSVNVEALITTTSDNFNVHYPLITSNRAWTYNDGSTTDIKDNLNVEWDELFPAVRLSAIMDMIQAQYNITFNSIFFQSDYFRQAFLLFKNRDTYTKTTNEYQVETDSTAVIIDTNLYPTSSTILAGRLFVYNYDRFSGYFCKHLGRVTVVAGGGADVTIRVNKNGLLFNTYTIPSATLAANGNATITFLDALDYGTNLDYYDFYASTSDVLTITSIAIQYSYIGLDFVTGLPTQLPQFVINSLDINIPQFQVVTGLYDVCPDIKVSELFIGILKQFNLVCYGISEDVYQIEPLDSWYQKGALIDITKYTIPDNIDVERVKLYKRISMSYQESKSFMNRQFKKQNEREYGDVLRDYPYDGAEYKIDLPFENLLFSKFTDTNLQVGYNLEEAPDYKPYTPKPIILYKYGNLSTSFKFNGLFPTTLTSYNAFGQDALINGEVHTLNFNAEISSLTNEIETNTLFADYYNGYLDNLYNLKNRIIKVNTLLPISILTGLRLNDRVIIRDKRYIINNMQSDLTTGEVALELINDFRPVLAAGSNFPVSPIAGCYVLPVLLGNSYVSATLSTAVVGVTITPSSITEDTNVQICIPDKLDKQEIRITTDSDIRITEDGDIRVTEDGYPQLIPINILYVGANGTLTTDITLIQI